MKKDVSGCGTIRRIEFNSVSRLLGAIGKSLHTRDSVSHVKNKGIEIEHHKGHFKSKRRGGMTSS